MGRDETSFGETNMAKKKLELDFNDLFSDAIKAVDNIAKSEETGDFEIEIEVEEESYLPSLPAQDEDEFDIDLDAELAALGEPQHQEEKEDELVQKLRAELEA